MKNKSVFSVQLFCIILMVVSCKTSERGALSCPDISMKKSRYEVNHRLPRSRNVVAVNRGVKRSTRAGTGKIHGKETINPVAVSARNESTPSINKIDYNNALIASAGNVVFIPENNESLHHTQEAIIKADDPRMPSRAHFYGADSAYQSCDTIILRSGGTLVGKVEEIGQVEIKYRKCSNLTGPVISVLKSNVSSIHYINGTRDYFDAADINIPRSNYVFEQAPVSGPVIKNEGLGIAGFISGLVGLFIASIPLGIIAIVFGGISLSKIRRNPRTYKGRGLAIAAIILGIVDVAGMILVLGTLQ